MATWVPVNAKKRKRKVPANSPHIAMKWFRMAFSGPPGRNARPLRFAVDALWFMPAKTNPRVRWDESGMIVGNNDGNPLDDKDTKVMKKSSKKEQI